MKIISLIRIASNQDGTFGVLLDESVPFALTVERPWLNNKKNVSCIPVGNYLCKRINSPKFGDTFEVTDVPLRSDILFHKGNTEDSTHGCIVIGEEFGELNGKTAVLSSSKGFNEFLRRLKDVNEFTLLIYYS